MIRRKSIEKESYRSTFELDQSERYSDYLRILPSQDNEDFNDQGGQQSVK